MTERKKYNKLPPPELAAALEELSVWETEIKQKDKALTSTKPATAPNLPPPRASKEILIDVEKPVAPIPAPKAKPSETARIKSSDYSSWDKFDVEKAMKEADQAEQPTNPKPQLQAERASPIINAPYPAAKPAARKSSKGKNTPRKDKALAEKEKGNATYQKGQYAAAVTHYSNALSLDASDPVFWINRAMAYLKLRKWVEAEKDCTQGLLLQPENVKALWRRGITRRELGMIEKAREDLESALQLEPENKAVKDELAKLPPILEKTVKQPQPKKQQLSPPPPSSTPPPCKQLIIEEVDEDDDIFAGIVPTGKPAASPLLLSSTSVTPETPLPAVAAPIARASQPSALPASRPAPVPPKTTFEFERDWKTFKKDDRLLYQYLKCIPPASFPSLFKSSLESDYFAKILQILRTFYIPNDPVSDIHHVLDNLRRVNRFDMLVMFLDRQEQEDLKAIFMHFATNNVAASITKELAAAYRISL